MSEERTSHRPVPEQAAGARPLGAIGGLVFAGSSVAALAVLPPPPDADASAASLRHYFATNADAVRIGSALSAIAALALLALFATLRRRLDSTAGDVLAAAGGVTVTVGVLGAVLQSALANAQPRLSDDALTAFFRAERAVFYIGPAIAVTMVGLAAAVAYRPSLPGWLAAGSGLLGLVALVGGLWTMVSDSKAAGGVGLVGFLLTILWSAASAIVLLREPAGVAVPSRSRAAVAAA